MEVAKGEAKEKGHLQTCSRLTVFKVSASQSRLGPRTTIRFEIDILLVTLAWTDAYHHHKVLKDNKLSNSEPSIRYPVLHPSVMAFTFG